MKKIVRFSICAILLISLCGCNAADEGDAVQQTTEAVDSIPATTETSEVIDKSETTPSPAPITTPGESLQEQYDIPKTYTYSAQGADGELTVEVDADIIVPDVNCMPMYQVTARLFHEEMASSTSEGCIEKYYIYYNITRMALDQGAITYDKDAYGVRDIDVDYDALHGIMDSTGIDFDFVGTYYQ